MRHPATYNGPRDFDFHAGGTVKKRDDLDNVIREERSRGRKRPINIDATREQTERRSAVLHVLRHGTRDDLRALLKTWGYSKQEMDRVLNEYDAALGRQSS